MKIVRAYKNTNTDRDVNIHNKQFKHEHLKPGDSVYLKKDGIYDTEDTGYVKAILHSGYCTVLWPWNTDGEPEICKMEDLMTTKKYNDFYTPTNPVESDEDLEDVDTYQAIGTQNFDDDIYAYSKPDEPEDVDTEEEIYLELDGVEIDVYNSGDWDYVDSSYAFAQYSSREKDWPVSEDNNYHIKNEILRDYVSVVEDFDELLEPIIPRFSGRCKLHGDATLVYDITGALYKDTHGYKPESDDDIDYTFDLFDISFNKTKSEKQFNVTISKA